jgi:hypothetical protein
VLQLSPADEKIEARLGDVLLWPEAAKVVVVVPKRIWVSADTGRPLYIWGPQ